MSRRSRFEADEPPPHRRWWIIFVLVPLIGIIIGGAVSVAVAVINSRAIVKAAEIARQAHAPAPKRLVHHGKRKTK